MKTYFSYLCSKFTDMAEKDYNSFAFKNSFIDKYNKTNQNIKNMVNKKISINETFGVDPVVYNEQKKAKQAKQQFFSTLGEQEHALSGAKIKDTSFYKDKEGWYPRHNFNISNDGKVTMDYDVDRRRSVPGLSNYSWKKGSYTVKELNVKPSWTRSGSTQANQFSSNRLGGKPVSNYRTFANAQGAKDRIVKKKLVRDAMKSIYGDPKNNLINKYGKR